jgi:hypothetical protein
MFSAATRILRLFGLEERIDWTASRVSDLIIRILGVTGGGGGSAAEEGPAPELAAGLARDVVVCATRDGE